MIAHARRMWRSIRAGAAGSRFRDHHRREQKRHRGQWAGPYIALGIFLVLAGLLLSIPPGIPGFIVTLIGAALIASRSARAAHHFDRTELYLRRLWARLRRRPETAHRENGQ